jgi:restriction system protein
MLPVPQIAGDGNEYALTEMRQHIAKEFKLTAEELAEKLKNGTDLFANRVAWAVSYLHKAGAVASTSRGVYRITKRGRALLEQKPQKITVKLLLQYPEVKQFIRPGAGHEPTAPQGKQLPAALTPEEQFENSYQVLRDALADELLETLKSVSAAAFERIVVDLLVAMGYGGSLEDAAQVVGKAGDGGIDGTIKQDKLGFDVVYVQAKKWQDNVGSPEVMKFCGGLTARHASKGVMISTSQFSKDALDYVTKIPQKIILLGGKQLALLMIEHNVGVTPVKPYTLKRLDYDYFENL